MTTQQYGVSVEHILKNNSGAKVPLIVVQLTDYLHANGLLTPGLFRRSVTVSKVQKAKECINRGEKIDFGQLANPYLAAVLLKTFLRELAEPVMTFGLYTEIMKIQGLPEDKRTNAVKAVVSKLPSHSFSLLYHVTQFLTSVVARSDANLMNANALAIVFAPNLAWRENGQVGLDDTNRLISFTECLLTNWSEIFDSLIGGLLNRDRPDKIG